MFENIIGLDSVVRDLRRDVEAGTLPQAILLAGPRYGGKSSVALELARVRTCHGSGEWGCTCRACHLHRGLQHPDTLVVGDRYFELEIAAAASAFLAEPRSGTAFLLVRAVRKLLRRFDAFLWPEARLKKADAPMRALEETMERIEPADMRDAPWEHLSPKDLGVLVETLVEQAAKLQAQLPHDPVPIDVVRAIGSWAHVASTSGSKVVVIEEAHQLQDAARNAMLKLLEEPPEGVALILTTSRRTAVIPTLLSRLRVYNFPERTPEVQRDVLARIFRVPDSHHPTLRDFFRSQNRQAQSWRELATEMVRAVSDPAAVPRFLVSLRDHLGAGPSRKGAEYLLDALLEELRMELRSASGPQERARLERVSREVRGHWDRIAGRNMNPLAVLEGLTIRLGGIYGRTG